MIIKARTFIFTCNPEKQTTKLCILKKTHIKTFYFKLTWTVYNQLQSSHMLQINELNE